MVTLVTLPDLQANSYASLADADDYIATYVLDDAVATNWSALPEDQRSKLLIVATTRIDEYMTFQGRKVYFEQLLQWPRFQVYVDGYYVDPNALPVKLVRATVAMALWLQANDGVLFSDSQNEFSRIEVGPLRVWVNDQSGITPRQFLPDDVIALLEQYGEYTTPYNGSGMRVVELHR